MIKRNGSKLLTTICYFTFLMRLMLWFQSFTLSYLSLHSQAQILTKIVWSRRLCSVITFPSFYVEHFPLQSSPLIHWFQPQLWPQTTGGSLKVVFLMWTAVSSSFNKSHLNYCMYYKRLYKYLVNTPLFGCEYPCMYQFLPKVVFWG